MSAYLTLDIDFWACCNHADREVATANLVKVLTWAFEQPNTIIVKHHHIVFDHASAYPADNLVNVDAHSDVISPEWLYDERRHTYDLNRHPRRFRFDCGTWGSFIEWRGASKFVWVHPYRNTEDGNCNMNWRWNEKLEWRSTESRYITPLKLTPAWLKSNYDTFTGISISLSPEWSWDEDVLTAKALAKKFGYKVDYRGDVRGGYGGNEVFLPKPRLVTEI